MKKRILITGGCGFVGMNVAMHLLRQGCFVTLIDFSDRMNRLSVLPNKINNDIEVVSMDLSCQDILLQREFDMVVHLAAWPHVDFSYFNPELTIYNNILSLIKVLNFALKRRIPVLFSSSVEVYGGNEDKEYYETDCLNPASPYGSSKLACESIIKTYERCFDLKAIIFRLTNLYGPFQLPDRIIPRSIARMLCNEDLDIDGDFYRDFVYIDDAVKAINMLMESQNWGEVYNIASGRSMSIQTVAETIIDKREKNSSIKHFISNCNKQRGNHLKINSNKIKTEFNWKPEIDIYEGISNTYEWYCKNKEWLEQFKECIYAERKTQRFVVDCVNNPHLLYYGKGSLDISTLLNFAGLVSVEE